MTRTNEEEPFEQLGVEADIPDGSVRIGPEHALNCAIFILSLDDAWPGADKIIIEGEDMEEFQRLISHIDDYQYPTAH